MSNPDQLLDVLQSDIVAVLKATPALTDAFIFTGSEKDLATRLNKTFGTRTHSAGGKRGLGIQVLPIFTDEAESNLPGPPLILRCQILVIENVMLNRAAATGTLKTSSQTALNILNALHHHSIGAHAIYTDKKPIVPEKMDDGFEGHLVTVNARANGLTGPGKPAQVEAAITGETPSASVTGVYINGAALSVPTLHLLPAEDTPGYTSYYEGMPYVLAYDNMNGKWVFWNASTGNVGWSSVCSLEDFPTPDLVTSWEDYNTEGFTHTGSPEITLFAASTLTLTCATSGASIYYTTDGSYPTPAHGTLYTAPFSSPPVGTVIRAAAYKTGLNPGDATEITIIES